MAYICTSCTQIYEKDIKKLEKDYEINCPKQDCGGEVVEIDDLLIPIIIKLWEMDFATGVCCSGHPFGLNFNTQIGFDREAFEEMDFEFPFLPEGFSLEKNDFYIFLTSESDAQLKERYAQHIQYTDSEKLNIILKNVKALNDWVGKLDQWMYGEEE